MLLENMILVRFAAQIGQNSHHNSNPFENSQREEIYQLNLMKLNLAKKRQTI